MSDDLSKAPAADAAEDNAWFPSPYSLSQYVGPKTDYDGSTYPDAYTGEKKVLCLMTDERYLITKTGKMFSTGNHPVESLLPILHLNAAGFEVDVYTLSGNPVKFEMWAMPSQDEAVQSIYQKFLPKLKKPRKLSDANLGQDSPYIAVFCPGGHGVCNSIPSSIEVKGLLQWAIAKDKHIISLCHGPAFLLAAAVGEEDKEKYLFKGYEICLFPDSLDEGINQDIGYLPGKMEWLVGESLQKLGVKLVNMDITGKCHTDRKLITGDSPLASNQLGKVAVAALLKEVQNTKS